MYKKGYIVRIFVWFDNLMDLAVLNKIQDELYERQQQYNIKLLGTKTHLSEEINSSSLDIEFKTTSETIQNKAQQIANALATINNMTQDIMYMKIGEISTIEIRQNK